MMIIEKDINIIYAALSYHRYVVIFYTETTAKFIDVDRALKLIIVLLIRQLDVYKGSTCRISS